MPNEFTEPAADRRAFHADVPSEALQFRRRLDDALTADLIATPVPLQLASSGSRAEAGTVWRQMRQLGFDILPIDDTVRRYWAHPRALARENEPGPILRSLRASDLIAASTPLFDVLRLMVVQTRRFYFTLAGAHISGLVTYADLDKRPLRTSVFALVNTVEQFLLDCIIEAHGQSNAWTAWLTRAQVERIYGYFNDARSGDMELSPVHYASMTHLIQIAQGSPVLRPMFETMLGGTWPAEMRKLRDWRDAVAHPGKPFVDTPEKVPELWQACVFGERVLEVLVSLSS